MTIVRKNRSTVNFILYSCLFISSLVLFSNAVQAKPKFLVRMGSYINSPQCSDVLGRLIYNSSASAVDAAGQSCMSGVVGSSVWAYSHATFIKYGNLSPTNNSPLLQAWSVYATVTTVLNDGSIFVGERSLYAYTEQYDVVEPETYTIKLSPVTAQAYGNYLTAIEPDGITRSSVPQNLINKVNLVAEVKDQDGNLVDAAIKLKVTALEGSGGHAQDSHTERNPSQAGKLKYGTLNSDTINIPKSGMANGIVEFEYAASAISGDHKIEATCTDIDCNQIGKDSVWVGIQDLKTLPSSSNYTFTGGSCHHQNNHYATERVIEKIQGIGRDYRNEFPNDPFLYFNDISLERGGLFDAKNEAKHCDPLVKADWTATHNLHRTGEDADVRANKDATAIPEANYEEFIDIARDNDCFADIHKPRTNAQHFHLYCTQKQDKK